jgi:hypothetical protein
MVTRAAAVSGLAVAVLVALCACSRFESSRKSDSAAGKSGAYFRFPAKSRAADTAITVTATGYGPLRIGMTVAAAANALGSPAPSTVGLDTACAYVHFDTEPAGMRIMVTRDTVARIEVDSSAIPAGRGARVGDSEARVKTLYGPRVSVEPHKYLPNGHYLVVAPVPPTDSNFRLIFETDGSRVTSYRAGRLPQVQWVEGCA